MVECYKHHKIAFVGAGSMAEALISGIVNKELFTPKQLNVCNHSNLTRLRELEEKYHVNTTQDVKEMISDATIIILAMKPKDLTDALIPLKNNLNENQLLISVVAGMATSTITRILNIDIPVVRAMPNTSAAIAKSATAIAQGLFATNGHMKIAIDLFRSIGLVTTVNEEELHAVTGLSGSGPAYVYYLVESMEKAANEIGLGKEVSRELIIQTIIGAAEMLRVSEKHPSQLRSEVTSPGGTTEAGIHVLEQYDYQKAMIACIKRAKERSIELGSLYT
ncbi:pyrroline-5-carboxylate reductase ProI [Bacillus timonensis]|nr:pyrroline-5-carboxylate reductase ProI [Bacillus timonensis]